MAQTQPQHTLEGFFALLQQSKLIERERLVTALQQFKEVYRGRPLAKSDAVGKLSQHLIDQKLITPWQRDRLMEGRHKGFFLGKYKLLGHIGTGGMSSVYLAEHQFMRRLVAIKVLPQARVEEASYLGRFLLESQATANLDHPNIVRAFDVDNEGKTHYMVMEYVEGLDLHRVVEREGVLTFKRAGEYMRQAALGLFHAHERKLIHRDIKPSNLLRDRMGVIKVLDMGLARITTEKESLTLIHKENVLGTTDYLAPEQALDSHNVDHRADIYSLGCTLYFILTARPPFPDGTLAERLLKHQTEEPTAIEIFRPDAPKEFVAIMKKMMAKKPKNRYQTMREVSEAFEAWLISVGVEVKRDALQTDAPGAGWSEDVFVPAVDSPPSPSEAMRSGIFKATISDEDLPEKAMREARHVDGGLLDAPLGGPSYAAARGVAVAAQLPDAESDVRSNSDLRLRGGPRQASPSNGHGWRQHDTSSAPSETGVNSGFTVAAEEPSSMQATDESSIESTYPRAAMSPDAPSSLVIVAQAKHEPATRHGSYNRPKHRGAGNNQLVLWLLGGAVCCLGLIAGYLYLNQNQPGGAAPSSAKSGKSGAGVGARPASVKKPPASAIPTPPAGLEAMPQPQIQPDP